MKRSELGAGGTADAVSGARETAVVPLTAAAGAERAHDSRAALAVGVAIGGAVAAVTLPVAFALLACAFPTGVMLARRARVSAILRRLRSLLPIALLAGLARAWSSYRTSPDLDLDLALATGGLLCLRIVLAAQWTTWLGVSFSASTIERGLRRLGLPAAFVMLISLTRRFATQLTATARAAWSAAALRGGQRTFSVLGRTLGLLSGVVLVRALDRTERVSDAMAARGYYLDSSSR